MSGVMSSNDSPGSLQLCYHHQRMENNSVLLPMESRQYRQAYRKQQQSHGSVQDTNSPPTSGGTPGCSSDESQPDIELDCVPTEELNSDQKRYRRIQANKRERKRMHTVNEAFDDLRDLVPTYPSNRKLSKIETLRLACAYIQDLAKLLSESTAVHGEDVNLHHCEAGFIPSTATTLQHSTSNSYPAAVAASNTMKTEFVTSTEFNSCNFQHYRVPLSYDYESCPSDPEIQSPPHFPNNVYIPSGLAVKPPALARVSSDTAVSLQMAQTSLATSSSSGYCGSPAAITPCSPLTRVQHSSPSLSHNVPSNFSSPPNHHFNAHHHYQHQMLTGYAHCYSQ